MGSRVYLIGAVRGLVSEGERVMAAIGGIRPDVVALSVSREGIEAMRTLSGAMASAAKPASVEEAIYIRGLSKYGKVMKPPPCFQMAGKAADEAGIPTQGLDMDDEHYTAAYCKYVSTVDLMRQGRSQKRFLGHAFRSKNPESFVMEWDGMVNRLEGYRRLEAARERWMARGIKRLSERYVCPLAVIELERLPGVRAHLKALECAFETVHWP